MVPGAHQLRNKPDEPSLWNSTIRLGEAFFNEIITQDLSGPGSTAVRFQETRGTPCARSLLRKRGRDARPCGLTGAAGWPRAPPLTPGLGTPPRAAMTAAAGLGDRTVRPRDVASRRSGFDACQPAVNGARTGVERPTPSRRRATRRSPLLARGHAPGSGARSAVRIAGNLARQSRWSARRPWAKVVTWGPGQAPQTDAHPGDPNP